MLSKIFGISQGFSCPYKPLANHKIVSYVDPMQVFPSLKDFKSMAKPGVRIPVYAEIPSDLDTPVSAFSKIQTGRDDFLLESVEGGEKWGRYSFLGTEPQKVIKTRGNQLLIRQGKKEVKSTLSGDPFEALKEILFKEKIVRLPSLPRFFGGALGFISYDAVRFFEKLPNTAIDERQIWDTYFVIPEVLIVFDGLRQVIQVIATVPVESKAQATRDYAKAVSKIQATIRKLQKPAPALKKRALKLPEIKPLRSEPVFCDLVEKAKEYIRSGDIFQIQVSNRFEGKTNLTPIEFYRAVRRTSPSPYLYLLQLDGMSLVGASPEIMLRVEGSDISVRPIAGTRRRGVDAAEDAHMEAELRSDPKERAEHVMLVDLGRNDLGRVAKSGSVRVEEQEVIERYSHVMHLVSQVSGQLREGLDAFDALRATFPAGTLTGAPKIRAMEIIEELEGKRRGTYGGCVGYIGFDGNLDMAITIRTALFHQGKVIIQAAAGIVYDSIPRLEYKECQNKARGLLRALESLT